MTRRRTRALLGLLTLVAVTALAGVGVWRALAPPREVSLHDRAVAVETTLRCPTCQGLSIADSPSPIAAGMRQQVEHQLAAGATPDQVRSYFTARYTDWILLDPPRRGVGWLVWLAPPALLLAGLLLARRALRHRTAPSARSGQDLAAAAAFAADPAALTDLSEPVTAALTDLQAARLEADLDPAGRDGVDDALNRLAAALAADSAIGSPVTPEPEHKPEPIPAAPPARLGTAHRQRIRYALPVAALVFAGLVGITLARTIGARPAGAVPTGAFATGPSTAPPVGLAAPADATRSHPNDATSWLAYATALDEAGRLAAAEPNYRKALALDPANVAAREQFGWLLTRGGSPTEALTILRPLTLQRPDDPYVVLLVGLAQRGGNQPQATTTLRRYLHLAPHSPQAPLVRQLLGTTP